MTLLVPTLLCNKTKVDYCRIRYAKNRNNYAVRDMLYFIKQCINLRLKTISIHLLHFCQLTILRNIIVGKINKISTALD